ncbi:MAG: carbohydrate ABC transporter permease [Oscillospiraceae bacterium]|jgi:putative aldouronate transport system permease protein|nr:carbohydrate ABC transporter permease [Oscillospiraceae bacterium]
MVKRRTAGKISFDIINFVIMVFIAFACILPLWHVLCSSFSDPAHLARNEGAIFWPLGEMTIKGYQLVFRNPNIITGYGNTILYVALGTTLNIFGVSLAGYVLSRKQLGMRNFFTFFITFTMMFSGGLIPTYMIVKNLGWIDKRIALIVPGALSVFNIIIMRTSIQGIPDSLEESAKLDGAGNMTILFRIILPLVKATVAVLVLFSAVGHWNSWFNAMIYLQTRKLFPLQLILREILIENDTTKIMVGSDAVNQMDLYKPLVQYCTTIVATAPILMVYPFVQKYFVTGVMIGSLKG